VDRGGSLGHIEGDVDCFIHLLSFSEQTSAAGRRDNPLQIHEIHCHLSTFHSPASAFPIISASLLNGPSQALLVTHSCSRRPSPLDSFAPLLYVCCCSIDRIYFCRSVVSIDVFKAFHLLNNIYFRILLMLGTSSCQLYLSFCFHFLPLLTYSSFETG
jgi:hypothetical protein